MGTSVRSATLTSTRWRVRCGVELDIPVLLPGGRLRVWLETSFGRHRL